MTTPQGVTAAFNLNLLHRINRELDGYVPVDAFRHIARWNDAERASKCTSRLRATSISKSTASFSDGRGRDDPYREQP